MASKTTLTAANLEALGAERLAQLLLEISAGDANAKRRLRLELAGVESPDKLIHEIRKRLTSIAAATAFVGWRSVKAFRTDLTTQRRLIAEQVATASPAEALELMWTFIAMGDAVLERATDASGEVIAIFREAAGDAGRLAALARPDTGSLAQKTFEALLGNGYGQNDALIPALAPVLGESGLRDLQARVKAAVEAPEPRAEGLRRVTKTRSRRKRDRDAIRRTPRAGVLRQALLDIADGLGDVDAYIALQVDPRLPEVAARMASRLLQAGRAAEALSVLDGVRTGPRDVPAEWEDAHIEALEALARKDEAQAFRLEIFHRTLNAGHLRAYLKRLPDFDDIEAEDAALDFVMTVRNVQVALAFLIAWPNLERAAKVVVTRAAEIDGYADGILEPAAEKLVARYPLAATVLLRRMIETTLRNNRSDDYERAGHQLAECARLSARIEHFGPLESHDTYLAKLRTGFGRSTVFWNAAEG